MMSPSPGLGVRMDRTLPALDRGDGGVLDHEQAGPTAAPMCLGPELRQLREDAHISREDAGEAIRAPASQISRPAPRRAGFKSPAVAHPPAPSGLPRHAAPT